MLDMESDESGHIQRWKRRLSGYQLKWHGCAPAGAGGAQIPTLQMQLVTRTGTELLLLEEKYKLRRKVLPKGWVQRDGR
jgi:hypothetical protein